MDVTPSQHPTVKRRGRPPKHRPTVAEQAATIVPPRRHGGQPGPDTLKARAGLGPMMPLVPREVKAALVEALLTGAELPAVAAQTRERYQAGEWAEACAAGQFGHMADWSVDDWAQVVKRARQGIPVDAYNAARLKIPNQPGQVAIKPIVAAVMEAKRATRKVAAQVAEVELRRATIEAEQAALAAIKMADTPAEEDADAKARLELLRQRIKSKISVDEEAEILVGLARGDNAAIARAALAQIQEILGVKSANVPETPGMASIFAFPEGSGGPAIR